MSHEVVPHTQEFTPALVEFYEQNEALADPATRRDYFEHLSADDFIDLLQQTGSILRTGDSNGRQPFDADTVGLTLHEVPDLADREQLLRETWEVARGTLANRNLSDEDALTYSGLIAAGGILYAHADEDSNGRKARIISHMMIRGDKDEVKELVHEEGRKMWYVTPPLNVMPEYTARYASRSEHVAMPKNIRWGHENFGLEPLHKDDIAELVLSSDFREQVLHRVLAGIDSAGLKVLQKHMHYEEGSVKDFDAGAAFKELVRLPEGGLGYAVQLADIYRQVKADHIRDYLRAMQDEIPREPSRGFADHVAELSNAGRLSNLQAAMVRGYAKYAVSSLITPRDHARLEHDAASRLVRDESIDPPHR